MQCLRRLRSLGTLLLIRLCSDLLADPVGNHNIDLDLHHWHEMRSEYSEIEGCQLCFGYRNQEYNCYLSSIYSHIQIMIAMIVVLFCITVY